MPSLMRTFGPPLAMLLLAACNTTAQPGVVITGASSRTVPRQPLVSPTVLAVQRATVESCQYLPTAATAAALINAFTSYGDAASLALRVAASVCNAVSPAAYANLDARGTGDARGHVLGVEIKGKWQHRLP